MIYTLRKKKFVLIKESHRFIFPIIGTLLSITFLGLQIF